MYNLTPLSDDAREVQSRYRGCSAAVALAQRIRQIAAATAMTVDIAHPTRDGAEISLLDPSRKREIIAPTRAGNDGDDDRSVGTASRTDEETRDDSFLEREGEQAEGDARRRSSPGHRDDYNAPSCRSGDGVDPVSSLKRSSSGRSGPSQRQRGGRDGDASRGRDRWLREKLAEKTPPDGRSPPARLPLLALIKTPEERIRAKLSIYGETKGGGGVPPPSDGEERRVSISTPISKEGEGPSYSAGRGSSPPPGRSDSMEGPEGRRVREEFGPRRPGGLPAAASVRTKAFVVKRPPLVGRAETTSAGYRRQVHWSDPKPEAIRRRFRSVGELFDPRETVDPNGRGLEANGFLVRKLREGAERAGRAQENATASSLLSVSFKTPGERLAAKLAGEDRYGRDRDPPGVRPEGVTREGRSNANNLEKSFPSPISHSSRRALSIRSIKTAEERGANKRAGLGLQKARSLTDLPPDLFLPGLGHSEHQLSLDGGRVTRGLPHRSRSVVGSMVRDSIGLQEEYSTALESGKKRTPLRGISRPGGVTAGKRAFSDEGLRRRSTDAWERKLARNRSERKKRSASSSPLRASPHESDVASLDRGRARDGRKDLMLRTDNFGRDEESVAMPGAPSSSTSTSFNWGGGGGSGVMTGPDGKLSVPRVKSDDGLIERAAMTPLSTSLVNLEGVAVVHQDGGSAALPSKNTFRRAALLRSNNPALDNPVALLNNWANCFLDELFTDMRDTLCVTASDDVGDLENSADEIVSRQSKAGLVRDLQNSADEVVSRQSNAELVQKNHGQKEDIRVFPDGSSPGECEVTLSPHHEPRGNSLIARRQNNEHPSLSNSESYDPEATLYRAGLVSEESLGAYAGGDDDNNPPISPGAYFVREPGVAPELSPRAHMGINRWRSINEDEHPSISGHGSFDPQSTLFGAELVSPVVDVTSVRPLSDDEDKRSRFASLKLRLVYIIATAAVGVAIGQGVALGRRQSPSNSSFDEPLSSKCEFSLPWLRVGQDITNPDKFGQLKLPDGGIVARAFGSAVSLSNSGDRLAVAGRFGDAIFVYDFNGEKGVWSQVGEDIIPDEGTIEFQNVSESLQAISAAVLSGNGQRLAVSSPYHSSGGVNRRGSVMVYEYKEQIWTPVGDAILGKSRNSYMGDNHAIDISENGDVIAIGDFRQRDNAGLVRVFRYYTEGWTQLGSDLVGEMSGDEFGGSLSLSANGRVLVTGSEKHNKMTGHVKVFRYSDESWVQVGKTLTGGPGYCLFGWPVSITADASLIAITSSIFLGKEFDCRDLDYVDAGEVQVFHYESLDWIQLGQSLIGEQNGDGFGWAISLSGDGKTLAIGASNSDRNGKDRGYATVYRYKCGRWTEVGFDLNGDEEEDFFGHFVSLSYNGERFAVGAPANQLRVKNGSVSVYGYNYHSHN